MEKKEQLLQIEPQNELKFIGKYMCTNWTDFFCWTDILMKADEKANRSKTKLECKCEWNIINMRTYYVYFVRFIHEGTRRNKKMENAISSK